MAKRHAKKFLLFVVLVCISWLSYSTWINKRFPYPWEYVNSYPKVEETIAWKSRDDCWENFRLNFPYHFQTIGFTDFGQDGSRIIIISEPPPHFVTYSLGEILDRMEYSVDEKVHVIGYDGWVKDVVISISGGTEKQKDDALLALYENVFQSNYKPHYLDLSAELSRLDKKVVDVNYSVSAAEINHWFLEETDQWFVEAANKDKENTLSKLLSENKYGVYYSKSPGFVTWVIPKGKIDALKIDAHRFVIDSDLILGAVAGSSSLALIGRERRCDFPALPPLRVETLLQLAAADKDEISQSYDRMNLFSGKLPGGMDWAPAYLSQDLLNTEYGSLLNITDQILKSWSQHGEVAYHNFMYKKPRNYPYRHPLIKEINTPALTFNWNTKGAAYVSKYNEFEIVALNRTGSLPVTYIPEGIDHSEIPFKKVRECEDRFYDFFSSLEDPNLIRVVQYASIYQVFSAFNVTAESPVNKRLSPSTDVPRTYAMRLLESIRDGHTESLAEPEYNSEEDSLSYFIRVMSAAEASAAIDVIRPRILEIARRFGEEGLSLLAYFLGHPRFDGVERIQYNASLIGDADITGLIKWIHENNLAFQAINWNLGVSGISRSEVKEKYVESYADCYTDWIKTPSIVLSWSADSAISTGGHSIESRMLGLRVDKSLVAGRVKVIEENGMRRVLVAAEDIDRITPSMIRDLETRGAIGLQKIENRMLGGTIRERGKVISAKGINLERGFAQNRIVASIPDMIEINVNGIPLRKLSIKGEGFVSHTYSPNIVFPESKASQIGSITNAMKNRTIAEGEFKVLSFVDDNATNATLKNYCNKSFIQTDITSISDLSTVFSKNPKKTFHLVGHIEDGAISMPEKGLKLPLSEIQLVAEKNNVNFMIVGCESAFEQVPVQAGFAGKINSVEVAEALGMAIESSKNIWTFTNTLARSSRLRLVVYEMPLKDLGYAAARNQRIVAVVGGTVTGIAVGAAIVIAVANSSEGSDDGRDTTIAF